MSTRRVQSSAIKPRTLGTAVTPWVRNPSWRALTAVGSSEEKFSGIVAVFPQGSYLALSAAGNYTVDWGDGASENVNTGVTANKLYDFNDVDLANTNAPVTLTDAGDLVERTAHGYSNGMEVRFYNIVSTTGLTEAQTYYVISATANDFQVAATVGGSAIALSTNGSATLLPYKQAIVTVTPNGGTLTSININLKNTTPGLQAYETGWLDIEVGSPNFTSITLGGSNVRFAMCERAAVRSFGSDTNQSSLFENFRELQEVVLGDTSSITNMNSMFRECFSLVTVPLFNTAACTTMDGMFFFCRSLVHVPLFNTAAVTVMSNMFRDCRSLVAVPLFNTAAVQYMTSMFQDCSALTTVPLFNTAAVIAMGLMFQGCSALTTVPLFNTAAVTAMNQMFYECRSLTSVPLFNMAACTTTSSMFHTCVSLTTVPLFNTAACTNMGQMFNGCRALATVPLLNTAAATDVALMFIFCSSLTTIPLFNTAAATTTNSMFRECFSLSSVPALNVSAVSSSGNFTNMFQNCNSLSRIQAANFNYTFSVANCKLGATELDEIYTNLPTVATTQTITVTGNHGTASANHSIAEDKGWTVAV
jgi:surface protein